MYVTGQSRGIVNIPGGWIYALFPMGAEVVEYHLRATWNSADDQGYDDEQVLDTVAEGVEDGSLVVNEDTNRTWTVESNWAKLVSTGGSWGLSSLIEPDGMSRSLGLGLLCDMKSSTNGIGMLTWLNTATPTNEHSASQHGADIVNQSSITYRCYDGVAYRSQQIGEYSSGDTLHLAIVLGGYDSNGVPWRDGETASSYLYGAAVFAKSTTYAAWTLLWRAVRPNTSTLYAGVARYSSGTHYYKNMRVPDVDLSDVLQPTCLSTFDASNGTGLDAITPEVGGTWTEQSGNWEIQGNRAVADQDSVTATVSSGIADVVCDVEVFMPSGARSALVFRLSDSTNYWHLSLRNPDDDVRLIETVDAVSTTRASSAFTVTDDQTYALRVTADGQDIQGYADESTRLAYASASFNETATLHGLRRDAGVNTQAWDKFAVYPRTSTTYDTALDAV